MLPFRQRPYTPFLPKGYVLESQLPPSPVALNRLLAKCKEQTHSPRRLELAFECSHCNLSIFQEQTGILVGFVRATSDRGLNANLWDLVAEPCDDQGQLLAFLVDRVMGILRRDLPGCSVSVAAPLVSLEALKAQGFLIDPSGIRAMSFRLRY